MNYVGWAVLLICLFAGGSLFFSVNAVALRIFSQVKLQEAFKAVTKKEDSRDLTERLMEKEEDLILTCSLYRLIFNMCILLALVAVFTHRGEPAYSGSYALDYLLAS